MKEISPGRILVPINGNPTDEEMVTLACGIAKRTKAEIHVIYIIEVKRALPLDADLPPEAERGEAVLEQAERIAESCGQQIQADLLQPETLVRPSWTKRASAASISSCSESPTNGASASSI